MGSAASSLPSRRRGAVLAAGSPVIVSCLPRMRRTSVSELSRQSRETNRKRVVLHVGRQNVAILHCHPEVRCEGSASLDRIMCYLREFSSPTASCYLREFSSPAASCWTRRFLSLYYTLLGCRLSIFIPVLKMEELCSCETLVPTYRIKWCPRLEDNNINLHQCPLLVIIQLIS